MKIRRFGVAALAALMIVSFAGCGQTSGDVASADAGSSSAVSAEQESGDSGEAESTTTSDSYIDLPDGTYTALFNTDSSMFHVNEVYEGRGTLTVKDHKGTIHIVMPSTKIKQLFLGTSEDAQKEGADLIDATEEEVQYDDGTTDTSTAFDLPVPYLDEEFDVALIGGKGVWYDHKVSVSDPR